MKFKNKNGILSSEIFKDQTKKFKLEYKQLLNLSLKYEL